MDVEELVTAWRINNRTNLQLLELCPPETLELKPGKGKTIRSNFVHIIGMRRAYVEVKLKAEAETIPKLDWQTAAAEQLSAALHSSSEAMEKLLRKLVDKPGAGKWCPLTFFAYAVAHEAHHRSQIEIALRLGGHEPSDARLYALWEWKP